MVAPAIINSGDAKSLVKSKIDQILTFGGISPTPNANTTVAKTLLNVLANTFNKPTFNNRESGSSVRTKINNLTKGPIWSEGSSLVLSFLRNTFWAEYLVGNPLVSSRFSTGTYFDSQGVMRVAQNNTRRIDYNPLTLEPLGFLVESSNTNNIIQSGQIGAAGWSSAGGTISTLNATVSPDGSTSASRIIMGATENSRVFQSVGNYVAGATCTLSTWLWSDLPNQQIRLAGYDGSSYILGPVINLTNTPIRYSFTFTKAIDSVSYFAIYNSSNSSSNELFAWGAQFEEGAKRTSYIPTTTAKVTRAADNVSIPTDFWWNNGSGTLRIDGDIVTPIIESGSIDVSAILIATQKDHIKDVEFIQS